MGAATEVVAPERVVALVVVTAAVVEAVVDVLAPIVKDGDSARTWLTLSMGTKRIVYCWL